MGLALKTVDDPAKTSFPAPGTAVSALYLPLDHT